MKPVVLRDLSFHLSRPHACSYLPGREAVTLFANPDAAIDTGQYTVLSRYGFRRSGKFVYRPRCPDCDACLPVRVPVADFRLRRKQRRIWKRNEDITVRPQPADFSEEHFALYLRYMQARHSEGGMNNPDPERYMEFLSSPFVDTRFYEFRVGERLVAVAVTDHLDDALSAVYTIFSPEEHVRSLGGFAILWQIETARRMGLAWLYLGYLVRNCRKMAYKSEYRPLEVFQDGRWSRLEA